MIRLATCDDAAQIAAIYNHYVTGTVITFEEESVSESEMMKRISQGPSYCPWLAAEIDGAVVGYAYAAPWNVRAGYRKSVETTVYVAPDHRREGLGIELYRSLISSLRPRGLHCALGVIALPNPASVALHETLGFQKVGELREVGWKLEQWVNIGFWQLFL